MDRMLLPPKTFFAGSLWLRGYFNARVKGFCKGLWEHRQNFWTFVEVKKMKMIEDEARKTHHPIDKELLKKIANAICKGMHGDGLEARIVERGDGEPYLVIRDKTTGNPYGSFHVFREVEAKQASKNCPIKQEKTPGDRNTNEIWLNDLWNKGLEEQSVI